MEIPGTLFTYDEETRLTAFETGPQESGKTVVFIGGLGDLYNAVPFLLPLQTTLSEMGFSLIQVQLSSSVLGYGTSSLKQDAFELDLLVDYLLEKRKKKTIVFLGHSTGKDQKKKKKEREKDYSLNVHVYRMSGLLST
jgi:hypothetical protein